MTPDQEAEAREIAARNGDALVRTGVGVMREAIRNLFAEIDRLRADQTEARAALARIDQLVKVTRQEGITMLPVDLVADRAAIRGDQ